MSTPRRSSRRRQSLSPRLSNESLAESVPINVDDGAASNEFSPESAVNQRQPDVRMSSRASSVPESDIINNRCAADGYRAFLQNQDSAGSSDLQDLERQLEGAIDTLWQSVVIVENFTDQSQEKIFHANIRKYMSYLSSISKLASKIDIEIPVRVLTKIDSGGNPDLVTKELAEICGAKNDETRGRIFSTRIFRDIFKAQIDAWNEKAPVDDNIH